jgi:proline iminopeptidase
MIASEEKSTEEVNVWPEIEPFETGYLKVSDLHEIYYELSGNPKGKPAFVLFGGPGSGPPYRRHLNPDKFLIVLHDPRGVGKSKPYGEIRENTTQERIKDIESLRKKLNLEKILLLCHGSGSILGLAYAEAHPENVSGMVMRCVCTGTQEEMDFHYHGGVAQFFPEDYEMLLSALPDPDRRPLPEYLYELIQTEDPEERKRYCGAINQFGGFRFAYLKCPEAVKEWVKKYKDRGASEEAYPFTRLSLYYESNHYFLEEGQLLKQADRISHIPVTLVHGRYDMQIPIIFAYRLHKKLPNSKLICVEESGSADAKLLNAFIDAVRAFE